MAKTIKQYMSKTRADYGSRITRPEIEDKYSFELKGQFLMELRDNTFSGSDHEDANESIEKVLEIVDLFHIPNITIDQVMLRSFPMSLTGAAIRWLINKPSDSITTWEDLKTKFLSKYCPLAQMQEVVLFYNGLDVPTRQILDSKGAIPSKTAADAKVAILEMADTLKNDTMDHQGPEENFNLIKEIRVSTYAAIRNQGASIKTLEIQIRKEEDPRSFTLPCFINNDCFNNALVDQGDSTSRALIDVHKGELTLRIENEAITYNLDQTSRYSANYDQMTANKIDVTDEACEEYSQEVLGFSDVTASGSPTPSDDPIVSTTSPTLTPFGDSDFILFEEADAFLAILNSDPSPLLSNHEQSVPSFKEELKACEAKTIKSSIDEPPEVELKDLPPHLEYAFLEGDNKLPVIITKALKDEEKSALKKVLKSHKRAIAWKLSDIQGINPEFYTHKILIEEDYKPAVQNQRRDNPKIHDVIKKEVEKLMDSGLIYPISDSPWVSPEKTTFTCPYETFAYRRMPFGLCNAPGTFQRCMLAIFHDMVEKTMEVFMDDFSVFGNSFENRLSRLDKMLQRCEDTKLCLNWEKSHFMVREGIVLGHKISKNRIEVDKAKIDVIAKLPYPITV
nr:reverse transcriptase domain-containing protein [Tanacetum cinerariifolium]